jgi:NAD+ synthase
MDIVLHGVNHGKDAKEIARETGLTCDRIHHAITDIERKRKTTSPLHRKPILIEPVPEIRSV